ncbi:MAG: LexA family protein [Erysipelotrichaceae bacterium]
MYFKENMRYLRKTNRISQQEIAQYLGYKSFTTIQKWEDGSATPKYAVLKKIAAFFRISVDDLTDKNLSDNANDMVAVLGVVRGGEPIDAIEQILGYEHVFYDDGKYSDCFYLKVVGDSMKDKRILPGDLIYVHKQSYLDNGDIGVVLLDNSEATVKQVFFRDDQMILQPANDNYQPLILDQNAQKERNVQIIGKVLHNRIKF